MKFQQPIYLENGGGLFLPPEPDILNVEMPDLTKVDVIQKYSLTTRYRYNGKTFVYSRGRRQNYLGGAGSYVNAKVLAGKGCVAGWYIQIAKSSTNIHTHAAGVSRVIVEMASVVKDDWKYGYMAIATENNDVALSRGILGNSDTYTLAGASVVDVDLDIPLAHATTHDTTEVQVWRSCYEAVEWGGPDYQYASIIGVPTVNLTQGNLDGQWFWIQTWGPCMIKGGDGGTGASVDERHVKVDGQGQNRIPATAGKRQNLGFILDRTADNYTGLAAAISHLIFLQIDP